ncbi:phosphoadenylyl-sulfate reductase [Rhodoluna sp. KAS3]|uniref:phosphoadenylyl-sulfate reductase n=1 Tax=Rhodoluna sp. KAS3 TaxID=942880 RepID=UPI002231CAA6|nr:phosphoadenylyl-sulfate reductase [Rhodoluna sp. KAS3]BDS49629.1 phosphoadenosine phosphosulfate reductase [Rhodoluna sp. KAS3]
MSLTTEQRRSVDELKELVGQGNAEFEAIAASGTEATAEQVIAWVAKNFAADSIAVACSMADSVLPHIVSQQIPNVDVLFLDTGYHFAETVVTRNEVARALPIRVVDVKPKQTVAEQDAQYGEKLWSRDPNLCCQLRKVDPLHNSLQNYELWFTGVRRDEAPTRANTPLLVWDEKNGLVKVNPLAAWTFDQLIDYATENKVPVNLLLSNGYPSIGCEPCTKPVAEGEDPRSGRWAGANKTECGLHI